MATKQQVREQITKVIQEGILTQVLPFETLDGEVITAQNLQAIVRGGQIQEGTAVDDEQTIIYQQDFQTAENEFNRFVNGVAECYKNSDGDYDNFNASFGLANGSAGITFSLGENPPPTELSPTSTYIAENLGIVTDLGETCTVANLYLEDALVAMTQFKSLNLTSTNIDPAQAEQILDTTIFELLPQQTTRQQRINNFFTEYSLLKATPPDLITDTDNDGVPDIDLQQYDSQNDIINNPNDGSIIRLNENANTVNQDQTLEWLRNDLNTYFLSGLTGVGEELPIYQDRSSGYLKFREMNQAIIIRNTENQQVIPDTWITTGFTITMWVKFRDKVSEGTLFNYGNPTSTTQTPFGFKLETLVRNEERYLLLQVRDGANLIDSHVGVVGSPKLNGAWGGNVNQLVNVPTDFNEWYFIVATFDTFEQSESNANNGTQKLFWTGNLILNQDGTTTETHNSRLGNKCKVEIISKTDLLRARGYQT